VETINAIKSEKLEKLQSDFDKLKVDEISKLLVEVENIKKSELANLAGWESFVLKTTVVSTLLVIFLVILVGFFIAQK
jgi:hypothetical protein